MRYDANELLDVARRNLLTPFKPTGPSAVSGDSNVLVLPSTTVSFLVHTVSGGVSMFRLVEEVTPG